MKKVLVIVLTLCMALTVLPAMAFADGDPVYVAQIGDVQYESLAAAVEVAQPGQIIEVNQKSEPVSLDNDKAYYFTDDEDINQTSVKNTNLVVLINDKTGENGQEYYYQAIGDIGGKYIYGNIETLIEKTNVEYATNSSKLKEALGGSGYVYFCLYDDWTLADDVTLQPYNAAGSRIYACGAGDVITIDLNGKKINQISGFGNGGDVYATNNGWAAIEVDSGSLEILDNVGGGEIIGAKTALDVDNAAHATLTSGTLISKCIAQNHGGSGRVVAIQKDTGSFTMNGGTLKFDLYNETDKANAPIALFDSSKDATVKINGGIIEVLPKELRNDSTSNGIIAIPNGRTAGVGFFKGGTFDVGAQADIENLLNCLDDNADITFKLVKDITNAKGMVIDTGKKITIDFDNHSYTVNKPGAGSAGTQTIAFQLKKDQTVVFKNGSISVDNGNLTAAVSPAKNIKRIIQNYSNLTLENMQLDGTNLYVSDSNTNRAVVETANGTVQIIGSTSITGKTDGNVAALNIDTWKDAYPNGSQVTINTTGTIGQILLYEEGENTQYTESSLVVKNGTIQNDTEAIKIASGKVTIEGGEVKGSENGENHDSKSVILVSGLNSELQISGGTITATGQGPDGMYGVYVREGGKVAATAGTINSHFAAIGMNNMTQPAELTISGGIFTAAANPVVGGTTEWWSYFCAPIYAACNGTISISGGVFNGYYGLSDRYSNVDQTLNISGGTFNGTEEALFIDNQTGTGTGTRTIAVTGGIFSSNPLEYTTSGDVSGDVYKKSSEYIVSSSAPAHSSGMNTWTLGGDGYFVESYVAPPAPTGGPGSSEKSIVSAKDEEVVVAPKASAKDGEAQVEITEKNMDKAIALAEKNESESIVLEPVVSNEAKKVEIDIPVEAAKNVVEKTDATLVVKAETAFLSIPNETLAEIVEAAEGEDIEINIAKADEKAFKEEIPELDDAEPVLAVDVTIVSGGKTISSFGGKALEVHVPVDAKKFKDGQAYTAYVFSADGSVEKTAAVIVNNEAVVVMSHFSTLVLTEAKDTVFEDAAGQWYEDMANYCYAKGLFIGDENKHFNGDYIMSEAELCTVLYRIANGSEPDPAEGDEWYSTAAKWAKDNKIDETFVAEGKLARGTFIKMFYDTLKLTGKYNTKVTSSMRSALKKNAVDYDEISSSDLDAVAWSVNVKLIIGYDPNELIIQPTGEITRAEVATMLMRYYQGL